MRWRAVRGRYRDVHQHRAGSPLSQSLFSAEIAVVHQSRTERWLYCHAMPGHRVSILSLHYPPDATGVAPYAGGLAAGLRARAHGVTAYVAHPFYPEWKIRDGYGGWRSEESIDGVAVRRLRHYVPRPPRGLRRLLSEVSLGARLLFCRFEADSVVVAVSPALFATAMATARIRMTPRRPGLVVWIQDIYTLGMVETKEGGAWSTAVTRAVEKFVLRAADKVIAIHPRFGDYFIREFELNPARVEVIRNWTHLEPAPVIDKQDARLALGWPADCLLAVHTGNMGAKQGLENVVQAARLADERGAPIKFILVGDGGERESLERLADGIERIQFVDPLDKEAYRYALSAADCLIVNELPGVSTMAVPSKLTSYFDAARPILAATDLDGIAAGEVLQAGAGVVVAAGDPSTLLDTAISLSGDAKRAAAYGEAGRRYRTGTLSPDVAMAAFERVIGEVAAERGRSVAQSPSRLRRLRVER
ncbi:glycosyltransferase [Mycolicibacterium lacusdiani]|uniref:glycosyltransferase n=1 Tax=Mycolicibacterium lacusdiani TaxID=2895283 RepID=UPI0027DFACDE|nr:glycosyltransferase [Mycolicibacterium lacusdiani]